MKNQIITSISILLLLAISPFAMAFASTETTNEDFLKIREATVDITDDEEMNAFLETHGHIPTDGDSGAFGYGILTSQGLDAVVVSTTHAGVLDSEIQTDADDPIWHNHFVTLTQDSENCGNDLKVESITFESPGQVDINDNNADITQIPESFSGTDALTGDNLTIEPGIDIDDVVSFKLSPQFNEDDELEAVCVTDIQSAENVVFEDDNNNGDQNGNNSNSNNDDDDNSASQGIGQSQSNVQ